MSTSAKLQHQLQTILYGNAWHGTPIYTILDSISFEAAYEKVPGATNSIAAIVLHMLSWTEEVTQRLQGGRAAVPARGNWPDPGTPDEQKWKQLISYFKLANVELSKLIGDFHAEQWADATNDTRNKYTGSDASYEAMITGLMQHHAYHAGQIALLNKLING